MANEHDIRYKKLFSNPRVLRELIESFVHEPWVADLDFDSAERLETSFISDGFQEKESDLVWKVGLKGEAVYIYLLLEFQSTVDRFMALRIARYVCEFYQHIVDSRRPEAKGNLPAVFPLVVYNGDERWTAVENLADLIDPRIGPEFLPNFRYFKIAENEISTTTLEALSNFVGALFLVDTAEPGELRAKWDRIVQMLATEHPEEVRLFRLWLGHYFREKPKELETLMDPLTEVHAMGLATKLEKWFAEAKQKGQEEGQQEGRQEGRQESKNEIAVRMHAMGFDAATIAAATGLSPVDLAAVLDNLKR